MTDMSKATPVIGHGQGALGTGTVTIKLDTSQFDAALADVKRRFEETLAEMERRMDAVLYRMTEHADVSKRTGGGA